MCWSKVDCILVNWLRTFLNLDNHRAVRCPWHSASASCSLVAERAEATQHSGRSPIKHCWGKMSCRVEGAQTNRTKTMIHSNRWIAVAHRKSHHLAKTSQKLNKLLYDSPSYWRNPPFVLWQASFSSWFLSTFSKETLLAPSTWKWHQMQWVIPFTQALLNELRDL